MMYRDVLGGDEGRSAMKWKKFQAWCKRPPSKVFITAGIVALVGIVILLVFRVCHCDAMDFVLVLACICAFALPVSTALDKAEPQRDSYKNWSALFLVLSQCSGIVAAALALMQYLGKS